jgi:hypothetical protein
VNESMNKIPIDIYIVCLVMARLYLVRLIYYHISFFDASHRKKQEGILMILIVWRYCKWCGKDKDDFYGDMCTDCMSR